MNDDPNSIADAPLTALIGMRGGSWLTASDSLDALTAAGYEVVPAGTADRLAALTDAIGDPERLTWGNPGSEYLRRIADAAAAVQPPDPKDPT
jgi:hypothetical protein